MIPKIETTSTFGDRFALAQSDWEKGGAAALPADIGLNSISAMRAFALVVLLVCLGVAGFALGREAVAVKIGQATSPDGGYTLVVAMDEESTCRIEVRATATGQAAGRFSILGYNADDHRYSITALWKEDSTAFAVNIDHGRNITDCRVFVRGSKTWTELSLPEKPIEKLRKAGNKDGGKEQDYLHAVEWQPGNKVRISYQ